MSDKETKWSAWDFLGISSEKYERFQLNPFCTLDASDIISDFISPAPKVRADVHQYLLKKAFYECKESFSFLNEHDFKKHFYTALLGIIEDGTYMKPDRYGYIGGRMLILIEDEAALTRKT